MNDETRIDKDREGSPNRDPLSGEQGAHPVGVGLGAAGAGAAGAAIGAVAGPVGAGIGAVIGAVAGGLAGKGVAESIDPTIEDTYWRENHATRPYAQGTSYDEYAPAYRHGYESYAKHSGRPFAEAETDLQRDWEATKHSASLGWDRAKHATRDAWERVERTVTGDSSRRV